MSYPTPQGGHLNACDSCATRKVKCDKQEPCSSCIRSQAECSYRLPVHRPRKRNREDVNVALLERLRYYEDLLRSVGVQFQELDVDGLGDAGFASRQEESRSMHRPLLPRGQTGSAKPSRPLGGVLGCEDGGQYYEHSMLLTLSRNYTPGVDHTESTSSLHTHSTLSQLSFGLDLTNRDPPPMSPSAAEKLWSIFWTNVDPLTKVVHSSTIQLLRNTQSTGPVPKGWGALTKAMNACAVLSMSDKECSSIFGQGRAVVLGDRIAIGKQALIKASFVESFDLMTLQAVVLLLTAIQLNSEPTCFWSVLGIAVRKAQTMGLHRDGTALGLSPYETEMRRRVWWYLVSLDHRASELSGAGKPLISQDWDTKLPTNIFDSELSTDMMTRPSGHAGMTDMSFCLFRYETMHALRSAELTKSSSALSANTAQIILLQSQIKELTSRLEEGLLRFCDPVIPLHSMLNITVRSTLYKLKNIARFFDSGNRNPSSMGQTAWYDYGIRMLEYDQAIHSNRLLRGFTWYAQGNFPWGALIGLLRSMCTATWGEKEEDAWGNVQELFEHYPELERQEQGLFHFLGTLTLKVWDARKVSAYALTEQAQPVPPFIEALLSRREVSGLPGDHGATMGDEISYTRMSSERVAEQQYIADELSWSTIFFPDLLNADSDFGSWLS